MTRNRVKLSGNKKRAANILGVLLLIGLLAPFVTYAVPQIVGADESYVVLSGSMSPEIMPGDVVIVNDVDPSKPERNKNTTTVYLIGDDASYDPDPESHRYRWSQTEGTQVSITHANESTAEFRAPTVESPERLSFELRITDDENRSSTDSLSVTVKPESDRGNVSNPDSKSTS